MLAALALVTAAAAWTYDVQVGRRDLAVTATFSSPPSRDALTVRPEAKPFVHDVKVKGKTVHYRFALADAAEKLDDFDLAAETRGVLVTDPAIWLLHPEDVDEAQAVRIHVAPPKDMVFATGLPLAPEPDTYETTGAWLDSLPMTLFGKMRLKRLTPAGGVVDLAVAPAPYQATEPQIVAWAERATAALVAYYGRFPVPHALIFVRPPSADGGGGMSFGEGGAASVVPLPVWRTDADLRADWVMTHEMVHLALPNVRRQHHWIEEGIATYVEPIARIRAHELKPEDVFADMMDGMPKGLPAAGDAGLDHTPTWGRTYWGGALYCLLADVGLRQRSGGQLGLENALRGILAAGGSIELRWPIEAVLAAGDKATGIPVLRELYDKMKDRPYPVDLDALWRNLGVRREHGKVTFDDRAPLAYVRRGIVAGGGVKPGGP